jgi:hypothetical protein
VIHKGSIALLSVLATLRQQADLSHVALEHVS